MKKKLKLGCAPIILCFLGAYLILPTFFFGVKMVAPSLKITVDYNIVTMVLLVIFAALLQEIALIGVIDIKWRVIIYLSEFILYLIIPSKMFFASASLLVFTIIVLFRTVPWKDIDRG
jgi:hypothetical protein